MVDKARIEADALRAAAQHERNLTIEGAMSTRERILQYLAIAAVSVLIIGGLVLAVQHIQ